MYTQQQRQTVRSMGKWLASMPWDMFSTITYRHNINISQNYRIMKKLEEYLLSLDKSFNMFWVTEYTNYNFSTHNHLLLKGNIKNDINYHLKSKSLIGDHVKHEPYQEAASMYVSKFICDEKTNWNIVEK